MYKWTNWSKLKFMKSVFVGSLIFGALVFSGLTACVTEVVPPSYSVLKKQTVEKFGTKTLQAPKETVFLAAAEALKVMGYKISSNNAKRGILVTEPLAVMVQTNRSKGAVSDQFRKYTISVIGNAQRSRIVARPSLYVGSKNVSGQKVWTVEGPEGERVLWEKYFELVNHFL